MFNVQAFCNSLWGENQYLKMFLSVNVNHVERVVFKILILIRCVYRLWVVNSSSDYVKDFVMELHGGQFSRFLSVDSGIVNLVV